MFLLALALALKLTLSTYITTSPATIKAHVVIPPASINRGACLDLYQVGEDMPEQSSCWSLNGEHEPATWEKEWRRLPGGEYVAILVVRTTEGDRSVRQGFEVVD